MWVPPEGVSWGFSPVLVVALEPDPSVVVNLGVEVTSLVETIEEVACGVVVASA